MDDKQLDQVVKEGWLTKKQRTGITSRGYLTYLARTNKEKGHIDVEIEMLEEPPDQVWMIYDSTYASNALAKAAPPIHRDSPNTALVTTGWRLRQAVERKGTKLHWTHVKGHVRDLTGGELWSVGNDRADQLAGDTAGSHHGAKPVCRLSESGLIEDVSTTSPGFRHDQQVAC